MKKLTLFFLFFSTILAAQQRAIKLNPIGFFYNGIELSYEEKIEKNNSVEFSIATSKFSITNDTNKNQFNAIGFELKYKFFTSVNNTTFEGFYIAPVGQFVDANRKQNNGGRKDNITQIGIGGIIGNQWIIGNKNKPDGFVIDLYGGIQANSVKAPVTIDVENIKGLKVRLGISIGYSF
jgi:hypothetical protein